jgi:NitT/TauT family transport system substrate-binding protein
MSGSFSSIDLAVRSSLERRAFLRGMLAAATVPFVAGGCAEADPNVLEVGGLPVTCNLTLPVTCASNDLSHSSPFKFRYAKYNGWPEVKESLMAGRIQAAYMLAPLVMDLASQRIPVKIVALGHRSGAVIMVHSDSHVERFEQLAGKRVAIPSRFAVDFLFLRRMLAQEQMSTNDIELVEMPPPDMPAALYARAIDAYCTGEPFGGAAQKAGFAKPLRMTRDEWRKYICCCLTVRSELIERNRPIVQQLVNAVLGAGLWLDQDPSNREKAVKVAAGREYFNQDPDVIRFVMQNPTDRVTYGDLRIVREEFEELMELSVAAGTLKDRVPYETYMDESFAQAATPTQIVL